MSKIVFYGLQSSSYNAGNKNNFTCFECTTNTVLLDSQEERQKYIDFLQGKCHLFDITENVMKVFNLKTKEDVYEKIKKEQEKSYKKIREFQEKQFNNIENYFEELIK